MGRNILIFTIIILVSAVLAAAGYLYYQRNILEKTYLQEQLEKAKELAGGGWSVNSLPVTDDPGESSIPIDPRQLTLSSESAGGTGDRRPQSQGVAEDQSKVDSEFLDISKWKPYVNDKYGYSFKFPKEFNYSPCDDDNPCKYGQAYEKDGGDMAWIAGDLSARGWPNIIVTHYENSGFALPEGKKLLDWAREKFNITDKDKLNDYNIALATKKGNPKKGVRISIPQTSQAYAREEIYFENDGKVFQIQMIDSNKPPAQEIYGAWLRTFVAE